MGEISRLTLIGHLGIAKRSGISQFGFQIFICCDLATLCKNLVKFGPLTLEFKKGKDDQRFGCTAPLLDLRGSVLSFLEDYYSVVFHIYARGRHYCVVWAAC